MDVLLKPASISYAAVGFTPYKAKSLVTDFDIAVDMSYLKEPDGYTHSLPLPQNNGNGGVFYSAVTLPSGVVLTKLSAHIKDIAATFAEQVTVTLFKKQLNTEPMIIAQAVSVMGKAGEDIISDTPDHRKPLRIIRASAISSKSI